MGQQTGFNGRLHPAAAFECARLLVRRAYSIADTQITGFTV